MGIRRPCRLFGRGGRESRQEILIQTLGRMIIAEHSHLIFTTRCLVALRLDATRAAEAVTRVALLRAVAEHVGGDCHSWKILWWRSRNL